MINLENYFDFISEDDIRLKGTRIGIETILGHYLAGISPELIVDWYPEISLEQVFATLTYYFANQEEVDHYIRESDIWFEEQWKQQHVAPTPVVKRLRQLKRDLQLEKATTTNE